MFSIGRRIKPPERGLLTMHPFADVLEGRSLFTAAVHDGLLAVGTVVHAPTVTALSPWSAESVGPASPAAAATDPATALAVRTAPAVVELKTGAADGTFGERTIGDTPWALFGNALHDRRGTFDAQPLPPPERVAAARTAVAADRDGDGATVFAAGRSMTGAMMPFLTMSADQANHPFNA